MCYPTETHAEQSFRVETLARKLGVPLVSLHVPLHVSALNGEVLAKVMHRTHEITLVLSGNLVEKIRLFLFKASDTPLVLGYPWLQRHNPQIDWAQGSVGGCGLNKITIKNKYPLPLLASTFELLQGGTIFTKLDLRNAYYLVRIREGDEWKTAFNTHLGHFEYLVMLFGLINAPAVFQAMVNDVLRDFINHFAFVYLDNIQIFSKTCKEHVEHVRLLLQRLLENRLFVKGEKGVCGVCD